MSEDLELTSGGAGLDRRDFIRKSAIVGGMVWAAPVIQSVPAFALDVGTGEEEENGDKRTISYIAFALYNDGSGIFKFEADKDGEVPSNLDQSLGGCQDRYDELGLSVGTGGDMNMLLSVERPDLYTWTIRPTPEYGVKWVLVKGGAESGDGGSSCTYIAGGSGIYEKGDSVSVSTFATSNPA